METKTIIKKIKSRNKTSNIINHDVEQIEGYLAHTQPESISTIIVAVVTAATVFIIDWRLGLCLVLPVPVALLLLAGLMRLWSGMLKQYNQVTKEMSEDVMEYISVMPVVKAFSSDEKKTDAVIHKVKSYVRAANRTMGGIPQRDYYGHTSSIWWLTH